MLTIRYAVLWQLFFVISSCTTVDDANENTVNSPQSINQPKETLQQIIDDEWRDRTQFNSATKMLFANYEFHHNRYLFDQKLLTRLDSLDFDALAVNKQIDYKIFRWVVEDRVARFEFGDYQMPFNADSGFFISTVQNINWVPTHTKLDFQNYLQKLQDIPRYFNEQISVMRMGLARGMSQPKHIVENILPVISAQVVSNINNSDFYKPFKKIPAHISEQDKALILTQAEQAILTGPIKAYTELLRFFKDEYIPQTRTSIGASSLPNGSDYYQQRLNYFTTLNMSADEIHQLGLSEVKRIKTEMLAVIKSVNFQGSFKEFLHFLRTDKRFYAESAEELLKEAAYISKKMDARLPYLFKTLPRKPYGVAPVPKSLAPNYTTGRYSIGGKGYPGYFWVNTHRVEIRPLYALEALAFHEGVPGHHIQISLAQELEELQLFRRYSYLSVFGEGWGLYAEWLGLEAGFYKDPYSNFGRLSYEMWRACRLVIDTGMHAKGWSRQQVMDYMAENTALSMHNIKTETDRYIAWPGQAVSYKIGELKIKEYRALAEKELKDLFDVREFHDAVLLSGPVPMPVLKSNILRYIASKKEQQIND